MKNTIAKIGNAALNRIFTSYRYRGQVFFERSDFDLNSTGVTCSNRRAGGIASGTRLYIYGLELGLKGVQMEPHETAKAAIRRIVMETGLAPSHIISNEWADGDAEYNYFSIRRFTPAQDKIIDQMVSDAWGEAATANC